MVANQGSRSTSPPVAADSVLLQLGPYRFKIAETSDEVEQVHRLNYRTFVQEIHQHADHGDGSLIDKFHQKNRYLVAVCDDRVVGMVAVHDQPPFSVADRLSDPGVLERLGPGLLEVRLLAIDPAARHGPVFGGLLWALLEQARREGYAHLVISGIVERQALYERLGFRPLGPSVRSGEAEFVPMALALDQLPEAMLRDLERWEERLERRGVAAARERVLLTPGPVQTSREVRAAFAEPPASHRSTEFVAQFERVRQRLGELTGQSNVALFQGSGTLANDVVAATIAASAGLKRGLILSNGEFGERLERQASRFGLEFAPSSWPWARPWDLDEVAEKMARERVDWIWAVHLETSTGMLNDLARLRDLAESRGAVVCVDCVSSLGGVPLDLRGVHLASGASGKALGSYAGVAIVFASPRALLDIDATRIPSYLDLAASLTTAGPRFTFQTPAIRALDRALDGFATSESRSARFRATEDLARFVRAELRSLGIGPVVADELAAPTVTTFAAPQNRTSPDFVALCRTWGFEIGGLSEYLSRRNWVQLATMGAVVRADYARLFGHLRRWLGAAVACDAITNQPSSLRRPAARAGRCVSRVGP